MIVWCLTFDKVSKLKTDIERPLIHSLLLPSQAAVPPLAAFYVVSEPPECQKILWGPDNVVGITCPPPLILIVIGITN